MKISKLLGVSVLTSFAAVPYAYAQYTDTNATSSASNSGTLMAYPAPTQTSTTTTTSTMTPTSASINGVVTDSGIEEGIKNKISAHSEVANLGVKVTSNQGKVSLDGNPDTTDQAAALIQIVQSTPGVKDIDISKLMVKNTDNNFDDAVVTAKIKGNFIREQLFGMSETAPMTINVETKNGLVMLSGTSDSAQQVAKAITLAKSVPGVKDVKSAVQVKGS